MNKLLHFREQIENSVKRLNSTIENIASADILDSTLYENWKLQISTVMDTLSDSRLRVGVVGSVKSGKSTLINAMIGNDVLKRGAGIITSFVTKVVNTGEVSAWVELKSISEVSQEIQNLIRQFSGLDGFDQISHFKLDDVSQRESLKHFIDKLRREYHGSSSIFDTSAVLLKAYLDGYERVEQYISDKREKIFFNADNLDNHRFYVGDESIAVFVKDMELCYPIRWLDNSVELADCQGSDSPNPIHLELLQEYLLGAHFIVYVISSRTGLREADFKLFEFIRSLNMFHNILFILNVDIDVHPDFSDLQQLEKRVLNELGWVVPNPKLFTFSALAELISAYGQKAKSHEFKRYALWKEVYPEFLEASAEQFKNFCDELSNRLISQRAELLFESGIARLKAVVTSIHDFAAARQKLMDRDLAELKQLAKDIEVRKDALAATLQTLENTIQGLQDSLKDEFGKIIQGFFDISNGPVVRETLNMIDNYQVDSNYKKLLSDPRSLTKALYAFYMDFKDALTRFLVEEINTKIIDFGRTQEKALEDRLFQSTRAFWALFAVAMEDYRKALKKLDIPLKSSDIDSIEKWRPPKDIIPPSFSSLAGEHVLSKGILFVKFGIGRFSRILRKFKDWISKRRKDVNLFASEDNFIEAVNVVKKEAREEILYAFRDYRQNFKYQYFFRLIDDGISHIIREFRVRAQLANVDLEHFVRLGHEEKAERENLLALMNDSVKSTTELLRDIENIRSTLKKSSAFPEANRRELVQR